ncbi:UNKNOWN [Stylonychia lemnae]|uniref:Semialdehyde dehydrogenase NAD-binding domain-containing protein n=1 Tax=Stylonychia lemnae TaxID=5949 RepID=A0A078AVC5_STYLE|nr:UNKNOWN [Stylonychia lemnae]|eukprot:CDW86134.1 UNKNOWN [Stylonychia lemnae]
MVESSVKQVKIAIIGGSGATGREIIRCAKQDPRVKEISVIVRRRLEEWKQEDYLPELKIIQRDNLDNLDELQEQLQGYEIFISCLGARIKVGQQEWIKVEKEIPAAFSVLAKKCGAKYFSYLSGNLVNKNSRYYAMRAKGEAEVHIEQQQIPISAMFRPGTLVNRDNDFRWVEWILAKLPGPKIENALLGYAMYHHSVAETLKVKAKQCEQLNEEIKPNHIAIENEDIKAFAKLTKEGII